MWDNPFLGGKPRMQQYLFLFGLSFAVSLMVTPFIARLAFKIGAVDKPNKRKIHDTIMPRLGGLAVFLGFTASALLLLPSQSKVGGPLLGGTVILLVGILDDVF